MAQATPTTTTGRVRKMRTPRIDKFGTNMIQNVFNYLRNIEENGPKELGFLKTGRRNLHKLTATMMGLSEGTVKKHAKLCLDLLPDKPTAHPRRRRGSRGWLPFPRRAANNNSDVYELIMQSQQERRQVITPVDDLTFGDFNRSASSSRSSEADSTPPAPKPKSTASATAVKAEDDDDEVQILEP